jgi:hypothetical protein
MLSRQYQQSQSAGVRGKSLQFVLQFHESHDGSLWRGSGLASGPGVTREAGGLPGTTGVAGVVIGEDSNTVRTGGGAPDCSRTVIQPAPASTRSTAPHTRRPRMGERNPADRKKTTDRQESSSCRVFQHHACTTVFSFRVVR